MTIDYFNLTGKVAVVTGGASGIGLGVSTGLAEAGATTVLCARRERLCREAAFEIADKTGSPSLGLRCDVTDPSENKAMIAQVIGRFERIDILVNCAGVSGSQKMIMEMEDSEWDHVLDVNLKSIFMLTREVVRTMVDRGGGGKIINVGSIAGIFAAPRMSAYCSSKAALSQLTRVMSLEWARHNIQANAIVPGYFETPMNKDFFMSDTGQKIIRDNIPARRIGQKEDIKGLAILLASPASDFMTGATVLIDGGHTVG